MTIIFCASEIHAEKVYIALSNLYNDWCRSGGAVPKEMFAFKCTAESRQPSAKELLEQLPGGENAIRLVRELEEDEDCDLYDVLAQLGFGYIPKTRSERTGGFSFRNKEWLKPLPQPARNVLTSIAGLFAKGGIEELEVNELFDEQDVRKSLFSIWKDLGK